MSVLRPRRCPDCGSETDTSWEIGRIESGSFGPNEPPVDVGIYRCTNDDCGVEFSSDDPALAPESETAREQRVVDPTDNVGEK